MVGGSSRRRRSDDRSNLSDGSPVKETHFFKIIHSSLVPLNKLRIPRKFMSKYGKNLGNLLSLKVPTGAVWQVELVKSKDDAWLCSGWKEFADYYSIRFGHFLVFRYDGNSNFHVLIFDATASEIEYPFSATHGDWKTNVKSNGNSQVPAEEGDEADDSVEILENFLIPTCTRKKVKIEKTCHEQALSSEFRSRGIQTRGLKFPNPKKEVKPEIESASIDQRQQKPEIPVIKQSPTGCRKPGALERAGYFKSKKPFFMVYMQPSYVCYRFGLNIPRDFARKYMKEKMKNVVLRVSDGRTWSVRCYPRTGTDKCSISWFSFARDNNLEVGDVCVFELIKGFEMLNVTIFRK